MNYLINFLVALALCFSAHAGVPKQWTKWPSDGVYLKKSDCGSPCFEVPMVNGQPLELDISKLEDVQVPDYDSPIWEAASNTTPCPDQAGCIAVFSAEGFCPETHEARWGDLDEDLSLEAWCTRVTGYLTKLEKRLSIDTDLQAARQAARDAVQAVDDDIVSRRDQVEAALAAFDAAIADWSNADNAAVKAQVLRNARAIRFLIKKELRQ